MDFLDGFFRTLKARLGNRALIDYNYLITDYLTIWISVLYGSLFYCLTADSQDCTESQDGFTGLSW